MVLRDHVFRQASGVAFHACAGGHQAVACFPWRVRPRSHHFPRCVASQNHRIWSQMRQGPAPDLGIDRIHAGGPHAQQHLPGTRNGARDLLQCKDFRPAETGRHHCTHHITHGPQRIVTQTGVQTRKLFLCRRASGVGPSPFRIDPVVCSDGSISIHP